VRTGAQAPGRGKPMRKKRFESMPLVLSLGALLAIFVAAGVSQERAAAPAQRVLTGSAALGDWTTDAPGVRRRITVADLPKPYESRSVNNQPRIVKRPEGAQPRVPAGFQVEEFAAGFTNPRLIRTAPNGDVFLRRAKPAAFASCAPATAPENRKATSLRLGARPALGIAFYRPAPIRATSTSGRRAPSCGFRTGRGPEGARRGRSSSRTSLPAGCSGRRPLDARPRVFQRRQEVVRLRRVAHERRGERHGREEEGRHPQYNPDGSGFRVYASRIETPSASPFIRRRASSGPVNEREPETTFPPTTSRASRTAASTDGPGSTSAVTRTRAILARTPSCATRCSCPKCSSNPTPRRSR
jgi:hypothetical protein